MEHSDNKEAYEKFKKEMAEKIKLNDGTKVSVDDLLKDFKKGIDKEI